MRTGTKMNRVLVSGKSRTSATATTIFGTEAFSFPIECRWINFEDLGDFFQRHRRKWIRQSEAPQ
jgi:hypothetical protein